MIHTKAAMKRERIIYLAVIVSLLAALAYLYINQKDNEVQTRLLNHQSDLLQDELKKLNQKIKQKEIEITSVTQSKDQQLQQKEQRLRREVKRLKEQRLVIQKHLQEIGVLQQDKEVDAEKIVALNKQIVVLKNNLQDIQSNLPKIIQTKVDSVKTADSTIFTYLQVKNRKLELQLSQNQQQKNILNQRIKELEETRKRLSSPLLRIEVLTNVSKLIYSQLNKYINLSFTILPNPLKERKNKVVRIYHLVYKYENKNTKMTRKLVTSISYRKQDRLEKSVKYNNRKAFEKGTHVFEAEVDGFVIASKTVNVE
ncbi:hypothetical protein BKI52_19040 [marine bacterium AO1-C]|nr:hypothetical protein BKI52_19040 [marine bacterium AO1-C]